MIIALHYRCIQNLQSDRSEYFIAERLPKTVVIPQIQHSVLLPWRSSFVSVKQGTSTAVSLDAIPWAHGKQSNHPAAISSICRSAPRMQMLEQFRHSGLTRVAFSRQYGVPLPTLGYWLTKAKRASNLPVPMTFSEIRLAAPEALPPNAWAMEIVASSVLTIRCREELTVHDLVR